MVSCTATLSLCIHTSTNASASWYNPMSGTPSANSTRLMPEGPALSYIFILMVFISPTFVPISGNSVWYLSTFTVRPLYSKPFVTSWAPELVLPSVGELLSLSSPPPELVLFSFAVERCDVHNVTVRAVLSCVYMAPSLK